MATEAEISYPEIARTRHAITTEHDISSIAFYRKSFEEREQTMRKLRAEAPVSFHPPIEVADAHEEQGFWAVVRADDVAQVARDDDTFHSFPTNTLPPYFAPHTSFFHRQDGQQHKQNRALVAAAFTPRQVNRMADEIAATAAEVIGGLRGAGDVDFVEACASRLPGIMGARILGIPKSEQANFVHASNLKVGREDPSVGSAEAAIEADYFLMELGRSLAEHRRRQPADDLMTNLVQAQIDGHSLSDFDIGGFTALMAAASNDTTKQSTSHTMIALDSHPAQRAWLQEDFETRIAGAVAEFLRWSTAVYAHARVASRDVELGGQHISAGDKVGIFYASVVLAVLFGSTLTA